MMTRIMRGFAIVAIFAATLWFGLVYGPAPHVRADIYTNLASAIPTLAGSHGKERAGYTLLNTNRLHYRISYTDQSVHDVLDNYQLAFRPAKFQLFRKEMFPAEVDLGKLVPHLPMLEFLMNQKRLVREESASWGLVSYLDMGAEANENWHRVFRERLEKMTKSGRLGDLGIAKTVIAVPNPAGARTTVLSYWTDADFNLRRFEDDRNADLPGRDLEDLPRQPQLRRTITFDQVEEGMSFLMVMYESAARPEKLLAAYEAEATRTGWQARRPVDDRKISNSILFLKRGRTEVQMHAIEDSGKTRLMINRQSGN